MSLEIGDRTQAQIIHSLGSVCTKYERIWSKVGEILVVTIYRLGSFLQYVRAGMGHGRRRRSRSRRGRKIEKTTGWEWRGGPWTVEKLIGWQVLTSVRDRHESSSSSFHHHHHLCLFSVRAHSLGQRSFSYAAPSVLNNLPYHIRLSKTLSPSNRLSKLISTSRERERYYVAQCARFYIY